WSDRAERRKNRLSGIRMVGGSRRETKNSSLRHPIGGLAAPRDEKIVFQESNRTNYWINCWTNCRSNPPDKSTRHTLGPIRRRSPSGTHLSRSTGKVCPAHI